MEPVDFSNKLSLHGCQPRAAKTAGKALLVFNRLSNRLHKRLYRFVDKNLRRG